MVNKATENNDGGSVWDFDSSNVVDIKVVAKNKPKDDNVIKAIKEFFKLNPESLKSIATEFNLASSDVAPIAKSFFLDVPVPNDVLPFASLAHDRYKTDTGRREATWRKSIRFWANVFKEAHEPACFLFSKMGKPEIFTCAIKEVNSESAVVDYIVGRDGPQEKTYLFCNVYGLEMPTKEWRVRAKQKMLELYGFSIQEDVVPIPLNVSAAVPLDRKAANEAAGRDYEIFLGHYFYDKGCHVEYHGLQKAKLDEGVDFILTKFGKTSLVQARNWSSKKKIGSADAEIICNRMKDFAIKKGFSHMDEYILVCSHAETISDATMEKAKEFGLKILIVPMTTVPLLKCVVKGDSGIVYGPDDAHYFTIDMLTDAKRWWAHSIDEAMARGHRPPKVGKIPR